MTAHLRSRREILGGVAALPLFARPQNTGRPLEPKLMASKYLMQAYDKAASSLLEFDNLTSSGKTAEARAALGKAAAAICDGLKRLADDSQFWATLGAQQKAISEKSGEIKALLDRLDDFVVAEEKALAAHLPPGPRTRLVSSLSLAVSRFRGEPGNYALEDLRARVSDSRDAVCAAAATPANEPRSTFYSNLRITAHAAGVLGGAVAVVGNCITPMALILALGSVAGGVNAVVFSSNGLAQELKSRKRD
jgi:hypothetical protein